MDDLAAARRCGLRTAFIPRPTEHGPGQTTDLGPEEDWDASARDGGSSSSARPLIVAIGCTRTVANPAAELEIQPPSTAANRRESKRLPITAAACKRGRACRASRSTRAVSRLCTLTGSAVATASWSNSTFLSPARRTPRSVRKLTISSANRGFPSDLSMTRCARASGRTSTSSRAWISCRISLADSGSNPSPVTIGGSVKLTGVSRRLEQGRCRLEHPRNPRSVGWSRRLVSEALFEIAVENGRANLKQKMGAAL